MVEPNSRTYSISNDLHEIIGGFITTPIIARALHSRGAEYRARADEIAEMFEASHGVVKPNRNMTSALLELLRPFCDMRAPLLDDSDDEYDDQGQGKSEGGAPNNGNARSTGGGKRGKKSRADKSKLPDVQGRLRPVRIPNTHTQKQAHTHTHIRTYAYMCYIYIFNIYIYIYI